MLSQNSELQIGKDVSKSVIRIYREGSRILLNEVVGQNPSTARSDWLHLRIPLSKIESYLCPRLLN